MTAVAASVYRTRLLNVVKALREAKHPERFNMSQWGGFCKTPACALGHYAARRDLQSTFRLRGMWWNSRPSLEIDGRVATSTFALIAAHFGLTENEADELFGPRGCGDATSVQLAIAYIVEFISRKFPPQTAPELRKLKESLGLPVTHG